MRINKLSISSIFITALAVLLTACTAGKQLATAPSEPADIQGSYTLLLYGCHYPADIKNVAILADEQSRYRFEIYDLETSYRTEQGVPAEKAIATAESFVQCSTRRVTGTQTRRILGEAGETIGFEVRPLYFPLEFGDPDVMLISYSLQDDVVRTYIRLDPDVEKALENSGSDRDSSLQ